MTNDNVTIHRRWVTHVRAIVHDVTTMPSPEIRAIAHLDMFVDTRSVVRHLPVARCFATVADECTSGLVACTPVSLASAVWVPRPPAILLGYSSGLWDWITPAFSRGIARVNLSKVARLIWPEGPASDVLGMADYVLSRGPERSWAENEATRLVSQAEAIADIFSTALLVAADELCGMITAREGNKAPGMSNILGGMSGDPRLAAMVHLSGTPMPPLSSPPGPWDKPEAWFSLATEELVWVTKNRHATQDEFDAATAELARREARDKAQLQPRFLLRSQGND